CTLPRRGCARKKRSTARTRSATPRSAAASPTRNVPEGRWRQRTHAASVTKIEARLASSVELATEVNWIDQCQKARSPAKATPAASSRRNFFLSGFKTSEEKKKTAPQRTGIARATR